MKRRRMFLGFTAAAFFGCAGRNREPTILLRSGWQWENIGDIAHTPGVLNLLEQHFSEARVILWSNATSHGIADMLRGRFPRLEIVSGQAADLGEVFARADFCLHGSGPGVVARRDLAAWAESTGKPYGIFGVTVSLAGEAASAKLDDDLTALLNGAEFVFTRETESLDNLRQAGIAGPKLAFVPDGTFSVDLEKEEEAEALLAAESLETNKFLCVIPRLRYTPYHEFKDVDWSEERIRERTAVNQAHAEEDHAKLREVIVAWVRETGGRVLLCPEMTYQTEILDPLLYDPLPDDVKPAVARRKTYWLTDLAASVYRRAAGVFSCECHSPIIAVANGTPACYVRQPEDGIKGQMWHDVGLTDWVRPIEETTGEELAELALSFASDLEAARKMARQAAGKAQVLQKGGILDLRQALRA